MVVKKGLESRHLSDWVCGVEVVLSGVHVWHGGKRVGGSILLHLYHLYGSAKE